MLKSLIVQVVAFAFMVGVGSSAIWGEIPKNYYLPTLLVFCIFLAIGCFLSLQKIRKQADDNALKLRFAQHTAFTALLLSLSWVCAEIVIADRRPPIDPTPSLWLFGVVFLAYLVATFATGFLAAYDKFKAQ